MRESGEVNVDSTDIGVSDHYLINPWRECAARVTVVVLCVCLPVCLSVCRRIFAHYRQRSGQ